MLWLVFKCSLGSGATAGDYAWLMLFITLIDLVERIESLAGLSSSALSFPFVSTGLVFRRT